MMRAPLRIIRAVTPSAHREFVVGDTLERAAEIERLSGEQAASRWLWREMWRVLVRAPRHRLSVRATRYSRGGAREGLLRSCWYDARYALRGFRRTPGTTAIIVLTLALGLGATTAIFSVVNAVLLKPLPYAEPDRLVQIVENVPAEELFTGVALRRTGINPDELASWRSAQTLSAVAVISQGGRTLAKNEGTVQIYGARVSPALFVMRGVQPLLGRGLVPEEERQDADAMVLGEATWREHFGSDPGIVGRTVSIDGRALTVVGVMPPEFGPEAFWTPFFAAPQPGRTTYFGGSAQLREGVSVEAAAAEINAIGLGLRGITPEPGAAPRFELVRELDQVTERVVPALRVLIVAVAAVLLIACTNVANLLLARGTYRKQEIAIRRSLGATRGRIVRLVLTESLTLAVIAGGVGVTLALGAVQLLKLAAIVDLPRRFSIGAAILPRAEEIALDPSSLFFVAALVVVTGALFGLLPAVRLSRFGEVGHSAGGQFSGAAINTHIGQVLATVQMGFAMTLLIGAGLLLHSFLKLAAVDAGFDARGVLSFELVVPGDAPVERSLAAAQQLSSRLQDDPRITAVGFIDVPPLGAVNLVLYGAGFAPEGMSAAEWREAENELPPRQQTQTRNASTGYLRALGARLVDGAWLEERPLGTSLTVLVSRPYAQRYFAGRSAVGATLGGQFGVATIVGVVDDVRLGALEGAPERVVFFEPGQLVASERARLAALPNAPQQVNSFFLTNGSNAITFAARTEVDPLAIVADVRGMARDIDPRLAIDAAIPMEVVLAGVATRPRFYALLLSTFGAIAGFIAVIGIYGVLAYLVGQRTKEIGVRMALGAPQASVLRLILRRGATMIATGVIAGVLGALALTRYLDGMLYGITELDAATYVVVAAAFAAVALLASYVPARHATRIDPLAALRYD